MRVNAAVRRLLDSGIKLVPEGEDLKVVSRIPLSDEQRVFIRSNKKELLQLFEGLSETDLGALRRIFRETVSHGFALHECENRNQAESWTVFLNQHLPPDRRGCVVREQEVNTYTISRGKRNG